MKVNWNANIATEIAHETLDFWNKTQKRQMRKILDSSGGSPRINGIIINEVTKIYERYNKEIHSVVDPLLTSANDKINNIDVLAKQHAIDVTLDDTRRINKLSEEIAVLSETRKKLIESTRAVNIAAYTEFAEDSKEQIISAISMYRDTVKNMVVDTNNKIEKECEEAISEIKARYGGN